MSGVPGFGVSPNQPTILYDQFGKPMAVRNGVAVPANTSALLQAGQDGAGTARVTTVTPTTSGAAATDNSAVTHGGQVKSVGNSTTATLGAGATFTGTGEDVSAYAEITINIFGTPDNATGSLSFQFSPDNVNWDTQVPTSINNLNVVIPIPLRAVNKFFRVVYTNNAVVQTAFRLTTYYHRQTPGQLVRGASQVIGAFDPVTVVRALVEPSVKGRFDFIGADRSISGEGLTLPIVGQVRAEFDSAFANNDITVTTSGGATAVQSAANGAVLTSANAAGASVARVVSNKKVRYKPGREFRHGFSAGFPTAGITGSTILYGFSDESGTLNRLCIGYIGATFGFHVYSGGTITTIPRASWNGDPLDGSAFSEFRGTNNAPVALDITKGNAWRIRGKWFGVGPVVLEVASPGDGTWVVAHMFSWAGTATVPYIQNPNMFLFGEVTKGAGSPAGTINSFTFSWNGSTIETPESYELYDFDSRKLINVGVTPQAASFTAYTVSTGRQLLLKSINVNVINTSLVAAGRLDVIDATAGNVGTLLHSFSLAAATNQSSAAVTQPISALIPIQALIGIRFIVQTGTLSFAGSFQGYEKEL